jgi:hypothetical protein
MRPRHLVLFWVVGVLVAAPAHGVVCQRKKSGALRVRSTECKKSEVVFAGALGPTGPAGPQGPGGELRIYGDGSAGARTITGIVALEDVNLQFTDLTIETGAFVGVPSGSVIRCAGTFTNNGLLTVVGGAEGAEVFAPSTASVHPADRAAHPGVSPAPAMNGEQTDNTLGNTAQGDGGAGLPERQARRLLAPGLFGGGGGGGARSASGGVAGGGGGSLTILASAGVFNNGQINASSLGQPNLCAGGGAGGVLIIGSRGTVTNNGTLRAAGGKGGDSSNDCGAGGGGGGGIVHLLGPAINVGVVDVAGGAPGATGAPGSVNLARRSGGGGGGGCAGKGGLGGPVFGSNPMAATAGNPGLVLQSQLDPTSLF